MRKISCKTFHPHMSKEKFLKTLKNPQTLVIAGTVGFLAITLPLLRASMYNEKFLPQVYAGQLDMSTKTIEEGHDILKTYADSWHTKNITLLISNQEYQTNFRELGIAIDIEETLKKTYRSKRGSNPYSSLRYSFQSSTQDIMLKVDEPKLQQFLDTKVKSGLNSPVSATYTLEAGQLFIQDEINGEEVSQEAIVNPLSIAVNKNPQETDFDIQVASIEPSITATDLERIQTRVETLLSVDFKLTLDEDSWDVEPAETLSWLVFTDEGAITEIDISQDLVKEYLSFLNEDIERPAKSAKLRYDRESQKVAILVPGQTGLTLNIEESTQRIRDAILMGETNVVLAGKVTEPEIYEGNLDSLGINTRIGIGTSNFAGSSASRVHNVKVAAESMNGILLAPGEEFSFVEYLGPVNAATGYKPELVIKGNETIPEYGGGVCQVSTTLFRAALYTGLEITERHAHSYVVSYYGTPGLDATIYIPKPDFRFKNTTDSHILLQYYINGTEIGFEIFGSENSRQVNVSGPITLSAGADGSRRTVVYRDVYEDGELISKDSFFSNYRAPNKVNTNPFN
jgi:vancomycin resistance protein YoaR